jgi:hypothetical protein
LPSVGAASFSTGALSLQPTIMLVGEDDLDAGVQITVASYDAKTKTFTVFPTKFPGEGDGTVSPAALAKAINAIDLDQIMRDPESIVGKSFTCDQKLEVISWEG